jgi:rhodanese-related sulfurtransferase
MPAPEALLMTRRPAFAALLAAAALAAPTAVRAQAPAATLTPAAAQAQAPSPAQHAAAELDPARRVDAADIDALLAKGEVVVLDVRELSELEETGTVIGAIHIPLGQLESRLGELPKDKVILAACRVGRRASRAMALLEANGFKTAGYCGLSDYSGSRVYPKAPAPKS